jgi:hypothetical protein
MTHEQIIEALFALGFDGGWSLLGTDIDNMLWLNEQPKPTLEELQAALGEPA